MERQSKWKHGPKPAVGWWFGFDPYPVGKKWLWGRGAGLGLGGEGAEKIGWSSYVFFLGGR